MAADRAGAGDGALLPSPHGSIARTKGPDHSVFTTLAGRGFDHCKVGRPSAPPLAGPGSVVMVACRSTACARGFASVLIAEGLDVVIASR
jgi:hypothetical protein